MPEEARNGGDRRPSPEALLAEVGREGRGRLKIFLGAAPGVGKTYEMLTSAQRRKLDGVDIVVGHRRDPWPARDRRPARRARGAATAQCALPGPRAGGDGSRRPCLKRRPALALVDELAHDNAPGSRHPKRWLDVLELLAAGIDVWTTMNVQHVESLNDVVAQITRLRVRETVPDSVLDRAEIELIDLAPDELRERLNAGKVYLPEAATRALDHYFGPAISPRCAGSPCGGRPSVSTTRWFSTCAPIASPAHGRRANDFWPTYVAMRVPPTDPLHRRLATASRRPGLRWMSRPPTAVVRRCRQRSGGRHAAPGRAAWWRDHGHSRRADRRGNTGLGARQQRHPDRDRRACAARAGATG